jgi:hypothetical protein
MEAGGDVSETVVEDLLADADRLKTAHLRGLVEAPTPRVEPFPELRRRITEEVTRLAAEGSPELEERRVWIRAVLGPGSPADDVEALTIKRTVLVRLNAAMQHRLDECAAAPVTGPGTALLEPDAGPLILVFVHSGLAFGVWCGISRFAKRTLYSPIDVPAPGSPELGAGARQGWVALMCRLEDEGVRHVRARRLLPTFLALLDRGEVCSWPLRTAGGVRGQLFGREVWTSPVAAQLARKTGASLVILSGRIEGDAFGVEVSEPVRPDHYGSATELQRALLRAAELQIRDPAQLYLDFPHHPPAEARRRLARVAEAEAEFREATARLRDAQATVESLRSHGPAEKLAAARAKVTEAAAGRDAARAAYRQLRNEQL